jgi:hypothetical protein
VFFNTYLAWRTNLPPSQMALDKPIVGKL